MDAVVTSAGVVNWWSNDGTGLFTFGDTIVAASGRATYMADFNSDGAADLAIVTFDIHLQLYLNDGNGHFALSDSLQLSGYVFGTDTGVVDPGLLLV